MSGDTSRTGSDATGADARRGRDLNNSRTTDRQWAEPLATNGQFRDRLWALSHGRRQAQKAEIPEAVSRRVRDPRAAGAAASGRAMSNVYVVAPQESE